VSIAVAHIKRFIKPSSQDQPATEEGLNNLKDLIDGTKADLEDHLSDVQGKLDCADGDLRAMLQEERARLLSSLESVVQSQQIVYAVNPRIRLSAIVRMPALERSLVQVSRILPSI